MLGEDLEEAVGREDFTGERTPAQRRLDSYSRLLAARSMCVSTSIIDGKIYISANEFFKGTQSADNNQNLNAITKIDSYFSALASGTTPNEKAREEAFLEVCSIARLSIQYKSSFSKSIAEEIAGKVFKRSETSIAIHEIREKYKKDAIMAAMMYIQFEDLLNDFSKLEAEFNGDKSNKGLISAFSQPHIILKNAETLGMHAEMQQLAVIVELVERSLQNSQPIETQEIYFGISKLCCLHCHAALKAAKEIFREKNIPVTIIVRGWHDLAFGGGWDLSAKVFQKNIGRTREKTKEIEDNIGFLIKVRAEKIRKELEEQYEDKSDIAEDHVNMGGSQSGSESDEQIARNILRHKKGLEEKLSFLEGKEQQDYDLKKTIKILKISVDLMSLTNLADLYKEELSEEKALRRAFIFLLESINLDKKGEKITEEELYSIMKDMSLAGEKLFKLFENFVLESYGHQDKKQKIGRDSANQAGKTNVNSDYQYEDEELLGILKARLSQSNLNSVFIPEHAVGTSAISLEQYLREEKTIHSGARTLLIPYNIGGYHWVGLLIAIDDQQQVTEAIALNSLAGGEYRETLERTLKEANTVYPELLGKLCHQTRWLQSDMTSCGPLTVENLLLAAKGESLLEKKIELEDLRSIRRTHVACYGSVDRTFEDRQRNNINRVASFQQQHQWLSQAGTRFSIRELEQTVEAARLIEAMEDTDLKQSIVQALQPLGEDHRNHLDRVRKTLAKGVTLSQDKKNLASLLKILLGVETEGTVSLSELEKKDFRLPYEAIKLVANHATVEAPIILSTASSGDLTTEDKKESVLKRRFTPNTGASNSDQKK